MVLDCSGVLRFGFHHSMSTSFQPVYLAGPTGSGKTAIALELARQLGTVEIVNADAFQVYRGMEIISAAPTKEEMSGVPHHLFGILDPSESCDAALFAERAKATIAEVSQRATPLVVGGSGLYLKAITHGLAPTPKSDPTLRAMLDEKTLEELVAQYESLDPNGAAATNLKNRRYVTRNLEISLLSGEPASKLKSEWQENHPKICGFFLKRDREELYERINSRTHEMFQNGLVSEIQSLGDTSQTADKAIGMREIRDYFSGNLDKAACIAAIQQATRRYAKRQLSWFKREPAFHSLDISAADTPEAVVTRILPLIQTFKGEA